MTISRWPAACFCVVAAFTLAGCGGGDSPSAVESADRPAAPRPNSSSPPAAEAGVEKVKPAPGRGNVQGKVLYNGKPAANIEVKLCEKFNQFLGGCDGQTFTARTDPNGEYVIADAEPKVYEAVLARVFDTDSYVFATTGIAGLSATKYEVVAGKTLFVAPTNLFKGDLKLLSPKAGARVSAQNLELKWEPYPDAAYYKLSLRAEDPAVLSPYARERVEVTSFAVDKPLQKGTYSWQVEAYNDSDQKLSESDTGIKFTVTDGPSS
jgi:hypothetical protein